MLHSDKSSQIPPKRSKDVEGSPKTKRTEQRGKSYRDGEQSLEPEDETPKGNQGIGLGTLGGDKSHAKKPKGKEEKKKNEIQDPSAGKRAPLVFDHKDTKVSSLLPLVQAYNDLGKQATFQERFKALRAIDNQVHQIFKDNPARDHGTLPYGEALKDLLAQTDKAHAELVDDTRTRTKGGEDGLLPFDSTGLKEDEQLEAAALWQSIAREQGELHVKGGDEFQKETFAGLAKLMQGSLGRQLVGFANAKQGKDEKPIDIIESLCAPDAGAYDVKKADMKRGDQGKVGPGMSPEDITKRVLKGEREVDIGSEHFELNEGSGAKVRMPLAPEDPRALDDSGDEVVTPTFIALGHELGHAVKSKAGAKGTDVGFRGLPKGLNPDDWNGNSEEYLNVKGVENPLRSEHNIKERGKYTASVGSQRKHDLESKVMDVYMQVRDVLAAEKLGDEAFQLCGNFKEYDDAEAYAKLVAQVEAKLDQAVLAFKSPPEEKDDGVKVEKPKKGSTKKTKTKEKTPKGKEPGLFKGLFKDKSKEKKDKKKDVKKEKKTK